MAMDLSNFKLLKEDDSSYEIGHPSGRKLTVNKAGLSPKAHDAIKMYAAGSSTEPVSADDSEPTATPSAWDNNMASLGNSVNELGNNLKPLITGPDPNATLQGAFQKAAESLQNDQGTPAPASVPVASEVGPSADSQAIQQGQQVQQAQQVDPLLQQKVSTGELLQKQEKNISDYLSATEKINNQTAGFYKSYNDQVAKMQSPQDIVQGYKAKDDALMKAYTDNKIDPNRFYKNESTGSRVASAIGLILSGAGSGVTGGPNLAMQQINRAVDADIDAQKNEQGKNLNLYRMNQEALGNDLHAQAATQNQLYTGVQAKVAMATAMAQNPLAKLRGQQMINDIEQQKIQNRLQLGVLQGDAQQPGMHGSLNRADPSVLVPMFIKDPGQQKVAYDEIQRAQNMKKNKGEMIDLWDKAASSGTGGQSILGAVTHLGATAPAEKGLKGLIATQLKGLDGTAREFAMKNAEENFIPARGDFPSTLATKKAAFNNWLDSEGAAPTVKGASNGVIDLNKFSSTAVEAPQQIKTVNGIKYKRGPKGEAIPVT